LNLAALDIYKGSGGSTIVKVAAVAGTGVLALPGSLNEKGGLALLEHHCHHHKDRQLHQYQQQQQHQQQQQQYYHDQQYHSHLYPNHQFGLAVTTATKTKTAGLAGLDSDAVRRWVAEAARTVRQCQPPSLVVPLSLNSQSQHVTSSSQFGAIFIQPTQSNSTTRQHQQPIHRKLSDPSPSSSPLPFVLTTSMTQTPSMHLLTSSNNLAEAIVTQQQQQQHLHHHQQQPQQQYYQQTQQSHQQLQQHAFQKQKQTSPTNNNTIEVWRSNQGGGHQWWTPTIGAMNQLQEQEVASIVLPKTTGQTASQSFSSSLCRLRKQQQQTSVETQQGCSQSDIDQPLDFSVGSLQQQRLQAKSKTVQERFQVRVHQHDNNNSADNVLAKIAKVAGYRRSYSPSEGSSNGSEDEGVSTGGSPSGPLRGLENGD
jgi:hypothetical protein